MPGRGCGRHATAKPSRAVYRHARVTGCRRPSMSLIGQDSLLQRFSRPPPCCCWGQGLRERFAAATAAGPAAAAPAAVGHAASRRTRRCTCPNTCGCLPAKSDLRCECRGRSGRRIAIAAPTAGSASDSVTAKNVMTTQYKIPLASPKMAPSCRSNSLSCTRSMTLDTRWNTIQIAAAVTTYSTSMAT